MKKQSFAKIFSTAISLVVLASCAGAPKLTPHILDVQLGELQEYKVIDTKNLVIQYTGIDHALDIGNPKGYGNNFFCVPFAEAKRWREYCLDNKCTEPKILQSVPQR